MLYYRLYFMMTMRAIIKVVTKITAAMADVTAVQQQCKH